jgi:RNA-directed DNA polymerase
MTPASSRRQDLQRRLYVKAQAEKAWRGWGLYGHESQLETRRAAYAMAQQDDGAPGRDGVTCEAIEAAGVDPCLAQRRDERVARTSRPWRHRRVEIAPAGGQVRVLGRPAMRDRVVQGALKPLLEPICAADVDAGSYG